MGSCSFILHGQGIFFDNVSFDQRPVSVTEPCTCIKRLLGQMLFLFLFLFFF